MLKSLTVKNYAVIEDLSIDFETGFNVFTGETGAGKSLIVGALSFLLKGRSDSSIIRKGCDKAIIEGVFSIDDTSIIEKLKEQDIEYEDELIVKRVISVDNHNSIKVNQSSVTLNYLTNLLSDYIDIHSQKDSQLLYDKHNQLTLLDKFSEVDSLKKDYLDKYELYKQSLNELKELENYTYNEREIEFFKYDFNELNDADLKIDEEEELINSEQLVKQKEKYLSSLNNSISIFDKDGGVKEQLYELINSLNLDDDNISSIKENISNSYYSIDDSINELKNILSSFESKELDIEKIEERLYTYSKLKRKHKTDTKGLLELKDELSYKIALFDDRDRVLSEKRKELESLKSSAYNLALKISKLRKTCAKTLEEFVQKECEDLLLSNTRFSIVFNEVELNANGFDDIEFYVSLNKGDDLHPLKNVASGGESSRLMLALKSVFAKDSLTDLLILDEIDTGVSGKVAYAVGKKIAKISKHTQVLCITHLSPVAACADAHYYIYKDNDSDLSSTKVSRLDKSQIINELASISNTNTNDKAIEAAEELYRMAQDEIRTL